jgi:hypothetical protein
VPPDPVAGRRSGDAVPAELSKLPPGYRDLFRRLLAAVRADDRVRAMWLSGSLGRGAADAGSDLDVVLRVADGSFPGFAAGWREWLAGVTPTVLARELPGMPGSWYSLTPSCLRLDVVTERAGQPVTAPGRRLVLDKDDAAAGRAADRADPPVSDPEPPAGPGPRPQRLAQLVEEFFRQQAIFPAGVVARGDWLLGVVGVQSAHTLLYELFVEANQPLPAMGVKQWSAKLTPRQRDCCAALPVPQPDRASVLGAMQAADRAFRREARPVLAACQVPWPEELDAAVTSYQARELGW